MTSKIASERAAALAAAKASAALKAERARAELNDRLHAINTCFEAEVAAVEKATEKTRAECAAQIAAEFQLEVTPLIQAWTREPSRKLALDVAGLFRAFDERAMQELGAELWPSALAVAFGAEVVKSWPAAVVSFGSPDAGMGGAIVDVAYGFRRALDMGPNDVEAALERLEGELVTIARTATGTPSQECVRRFQLRNTCATYGDAAQKLEAFNEAEAARQQREFAASYEAPEPVSWRARVSGALFGGA